MTLCRRTLGSERHHRHAFEWLDEFGTGPMVDDGNIYLDGVAESGRNLVVSEP